MGAVRVFCGRWNISQNRRVGNDNTQVCVLSRAKLDFVPLTAPKIFAISSSRDKNSSHSFARLSAWWMNKGGTPAPDCNDRRVGNDNTQVCVLSRAKLDFVLLTAHQN